MTKQRDDRKRNERAAFWEDFGASSISYPDGCWTEFDGTGQETARCKSEDHDPAAHEFSPVAS